MAGDSGVETCPSPVNGSRKRPLEGESFGGEPKRSLLTGGEGTHHLKILVPSAAAGGIIGKGGETIAQLQKESGVRMTMSKSQDFYPGTTERVCLLTGTVDAIMAVLEFVMDKISERPDSRANDRDRHVKILVPNATAGMIIGKAGDYIKQIKDASGSYVQISQKAVDVSTLRERCITVVGDRRQNMTACKMILDKIAADPRSGTCLNVSYAEVNGPVANVNPTGSPFALNSSAAGPDPASLTAATNGSMLGAGLNLSVNIAPAASMPGNLDHVVGQLKGYGYTDAQVAEIYQALNVLAKYGILGVGGGGGQMQGTAPPRERWSRTAVSEEEY